MLVECRSADDTPVTPGMLTLKFTDAKDGTPVNALLFDVEKR